MNNYKVYLAPLEGLADGPMRKVLCAHGGYDLCFSEFIRVTDLVVSEKTLLREIPEGARQDVTYVKVNCTEIATSLGNPKGANIVMTGAIIKLMGDFTHDAAVAAMNHMFAKKGKSKFNESNARAFDAGFNAV